MDASVIQKRIELLENAKKEYQIKKQMLADSLATDEELLTLEEESKNAKRKLTAQKQALLNEPENRKLQADLKDLALEMKDLKALLGDELLAYFMESKSLEYTDPSGQKRRFKVSAQFTSEKPE
ncbi:hypothetical protein KGQ71_03745 [Patescibacteria group bacterium]|nr:hypothetical protein [Patescibacteria group bacterium]